jgi:hypothetical protein
MSTPFARLAVLVLALAPLCAVAQEPVAGQSHLLYVPSTAPGVDHEGIVQSLSDMGFAVSTLATTGETDATYARRVAREVRALLDQGVAPEDITVVGAGTGTPVAVLASAATGHRRVNFVLLGDCDPQMKNDYPGGFRMAGRVLGIRDAADADSDSCRPLWTGAPRVSARQDLVLNTRFGEALFDAPRIEWTQPLMEWSTGGKVDIGDVEITMVPARARPATGVAD